MGASIFLAKILLYTMVGLSFLYVIYKATLSLLQKTGLSAKLKVREGKFSLKNMRIKGYEYHESTYTRTEYAEALIRKEDIKRIQSLIPKYNDKESFFFNTLRLTIDHAKQSTYIYDSILYQAYCNGFKTGFWRLDEIIYKHKSYSTGDLDTKIQQYLDKYTINEKCDNPSKKTLQFCIKIGKQQGASVRKILFEIDNQERRKLMDVFINLEDDSYKEGLKDRIGLYLSEKGKGRQAGLAYIALHELQLIEINAATFIRVLKNTFSNFTSANTAIYEYSKKDNLDNKNTEELNKLIMELTQFMESLKNSN